jgi:hypothetical protein
MFLNEVIRHRRHISIPSGMCIVHSFGSEITPLVDSRPRDIHISYRLCFYLKIVLLHSHKFQGTAIVKFVTPFKKICHSI